MSGAHTHEARAGARHRKPLAIAFVLVVVFMVAEAVAGWIAGSLALVSDAGHMATDAVGLGMALAAIVSADRSLSDAGRTFGSYRLEILAALANAVLLFAVAGYVLYEAATRLSDPPDVLSGAMAITAFIGLVVNVVSWRLLRAGADESLNVEGAYVEVLADLFGSIGVLAAAMLIWFTGWNIVDPIVGAAVGVFILPRAWRLGRKAIRILIQAAPVGLDLASLAEQLETIPDVIDVHDLHVWTLTSEMDVGTAHIMTTTTADPHAVLDRARHILSGAGISHATLQVEPDSHEGCAELTW